MTFSIHTLPISGDTILAPMDGYSDWPFRSVCRELGSAMSYTEFINALDVLQGHPYNHRKLVFLPEERPVVYQIFDSDPDRLLEVALRLQAHGPDVIDVNLGCSAKQVSGRGAGAGLLRTPEKIAEIFRKLTHSLGVPVTAKMRLGWDDASRNYLEIARLLEDHGAAAIAVHARTKAQAYGGQADWDAIAEIVQAVRIPVIGNGDVRLPEDIERMKAHTGCAAVMIGRGAVGNPWIFARQAREAVPLETVRRTVGVHFERTLACYGEAHGLLIFRKHADRYLRPYAPPVEIRQRLLTTSSVSEFQSLLDEIFLSQI